MEKLVKFCKNITRTKSPLTERTQLQPVLTTFSLTFLGLGVTIGTGLFVVTGLIAREYAGPSAVLSFLLAAIITFPSAMCYAEFSCRYRQAGSAYLYTYTSVGEVFAIIVGWCMLLVYIAAAAIQGRAIVEYADVLLNGKLEQFNANIFGEVDLLGNRYSFNVVGVFIMTLTTLVLLTGSRGSTRSNEILTSIKLFAAVFIIVTGSVYADVDNWSNFMPYGILGIIRASSICFMSFVGFDSIAAASEEAKDPESSIPKAIFLCLATACLLYVGVSTVLSLMVPYNQLLPHAPLAQAFDQVGLTWVKYVINFSALAGLLAVSIGALFTASRTFYSMSRDGLFFKYFSAVNKTIVIPMRAIILSGCLAATGTFFFDLESIVEMINIGIVVTYIFVAISVILLRFSPEKSLQADEISNTHERHSSSWLDRFLYKGGVRHYNKLTNQEDHHENDSKFMMQKNCNIIYICIVLMIILLVVVLNILNFSFSAIASGSPGVITALVLSILALFCTIIPFFYFPRNQMNMAFTVPLFPLTPLLAISSALLISINLHWMTWIGAFVWVSVGLLIYFFYGISNSIEGNTEDPLNFIDNFSPAENTDDNDMEIVEK